MLTRTICYLSLILFPLACYSAEPMPESAPENSPETKKTHPANRLSAESSPYLLLHAHNPVDWYPWGPEAFDQAKAANKPIFLSIGYSSCYWCHVMERLVFENEEIATYMNEHFINIKVDREERPDVDDIYMTSLIVYFQLIGSPQGGGWPLSMFLTPEGKPFAGGSYFPPNDEGGRIGFPTVMSRVTELWRDKEQQIRDNADSITSVLQKQMRPKLNLESRPLEASFVESTVEAVKATYDAEYGGVDFREGSPQSPKFPVPSKLRLLLEESVRNDDEQARKIVLHSLTEIAKGGIRDHLGGGFHRYSTDRQWLVPHFEKMLYDQSQLASIYLRAWELTQDELYRDAAVTTLDFVLRQMTDKDGGFYSAFDAETDAVEGKFYVWSKDEIKSELGEKDAATYFSWFGLDEPLPFEHGYILHLPRTQAIEKPAELAAWNAKLLAVREQRKQPLLDDKVLTSWNGLMIRAFADAGRILQEPRYTQAATKAADFILDQMTDEEGRLLRTWRKGKAKLNAYLDDYAFLIDGLLAIYETTDEEQWLSKAVELQKRQDELFWDETGNGYFFTSHNHEDLIARTKNAYDAVLPAGNSVAALNLLTLAEATNNSEHRTRAADLIRVFLPVFTENPRGMSVMSLALATYLDGEVATDQSEKQNSAILTETEIVPVSFQLGDDKHLVKITPYLNVDKLPAGGRCRIVLYVEIDNGWHINTNPAQPEFFIPSVFSIESKGGVKLGKIKYPKGKKFTVEGLDEPLMVYEGKIALHGELQIPKSLAGKKESIEIKLQYQACNDKTCKPKKTITVGGAVPVAAEGETVKQINKKHFSEK